MQIALSRFIFFGIILLNIVMTVGNCFGYSSSDNVTYIGIFDTDIARSVAISENYAYITVYNAFEIVDITNPTSPNLVGSCTTGVDGYGVAISGNYAYLVSGIDGLFIVDISTPSSPSLVGTYNTTDAQNVAVSGSYAYVADGNGGLRVIDITTPAAPSLVTTYDTPGYAHDIALSGNYAYVADSGNGLLIVDISTPSSLTLAGRYDTAGTAYEVAVSGNYAYVADYDGGLVIVNVTDPSAPTLIDIYVTTDEVSHVAVAGNYAYFDDDRYSLVVLDITNPSAPKLKGSYYNTAFWSISDVEVSGNYAYVADPTNGLWILDISPPTFVGNYDTAGHASGVAISSNYAYVADGTSGLEIVDISNPSSPTLMGTFNTAGHAMDVNVKGNYAYVADGENGIVIVDITNPSSPTLVGSYNTKGWAWDVDVRKHAYVADGTNGLVILDITDPSSPILMNIYKPVYRYPGQVYDVEVSDKYVYITDYNHGLVITPILKPFFLTTKFPFSRTHLYNVSEAIDVTASRNYAYVAAGFNGIIVADTSGDSIKNPVGSYDNPSPIFANVNEFFNYTDAQAYDVEVSGNYAYVAWLNQGLIILDISDPTSPIRVSRDFSTQCASDVEISGKYAYIADGENGLVILLIDTAPTSTVSHTPVYDNRLRASSPNTVLSSSNYIDIGRISTTSYRDVMWFDLSGYNPTDTIFKATLSLYWYYPPGATRTSDTVVEVYRPVQWDPQYVTWNSRMSGTPWTTPGGNWFDKNGVSQGTTPYVSLTLAGSKVPDSKYYKFDVTQLVQEYVSGKYTNTGFFLKARTESGNYIAFYSSEWTNATMRPKLTITS